MVENLGYSFCTGGSVDKTPVICSGIKHTRVSKCYYHVRNSNSWKLIGNMNTARWGAASIVINSKLWVIGGYNIGEFTDTTEFIDMRNVGQITYGPRLTEGRAFHCVVKLNEDETMIIGADFPTSLRRKTEIYNTINGNWRDGPTLNNDRRHSACALFQSSLHNNRKVVLVAGGGTDTAEILDYSQLNAQWVLSK